MPNHRRTSSWTLLGDDGEVVKPAERYLAYLAAIERSPDTVRAYAVSLKLWLEFLQHATVNCPRRDHPPASGNRSLREQIARRLGLQRTQHGEPTPAEPT